MTVKDGSIIKERISKMMADLNSIGAEAEDMQHLILKANDKQISKVIDKTALKKLLKDSCSQILLKIDSIRILIDII